MTLSVKSVVNVEMIRDGGSQAATFHDARGGEWILFLPIDQDIGAGHRERLGFKEPYLIDADLAKRPADTPGRIYSPLCGPSSPICWEEAQILVNQISALATDLNEFAGLALARIQFAVAHLGQLPPDMKSNMNE